VRFLKDIGATFHVSFVVSQFEDLKYGSGGNCEGMPVVWQVHMAEVKGFSFLADFSFSPICQISIYTHLAITIPEPTL
jgi:hypothetical protein